MDILLFSALARVPATGGARPLGFAIVLMDFTVQTVRFAPAL